MGDWAGSIGPGTPGDWYGSGGRWQERCVSLTYLRPPSM